jgi:protein TonB
MKRVLFHLVIALILVGSVAFAQQSSTSGSQGVAGDRPGGTLDMLPPTPGRVRVSQRVAEGLCTRKTHFLYPEDARKAHIQGQVVLQVLIDKNGDIEKATLVSGHPALAPAAIDAVKQWKYKPYLLKGQPVTMETQVVVNFTLSGGLKR